MKKILLIVSISIVAILSSLGLVTWFKMRPINLQDIPELQDRIHNYYAHEKAMEWREAYFFRTPLFRSTISLENYINSMSLDNDGWKLLDYEIVRSRKIGDSKVKVKIRFNEEMPSTFAEKFNIKSTGALLNFNFEQETIWKYVEDNWYCVDAGSRMHLTSNAMIVRE